jgi:hypothetical protein
VQIVCSVVMIGVFGLSATTTDSQGRTKHVVGSLQVCVLPSGMMTERFLCRNALHYR